VSPTDNLIIDDSIVEDNIKNEHHQNDGSFGTQKRIVVFRLRRK
jgi:hypothetical protein